MLTRVITVTALAAVSLAASTALAAPPAGKGKPAPIGGACKPKIAVVVKGTLAAATPATSVTLTVTGGNAFAKAYRTAAQPLVVALTATTKVTREDDATAALQVGDLVNVRASVCKADLANGGMPALTAVRVVAHAPEA
jgi:hypothetical protein